MAFDRECSWKKGIDGHSRRGKAGWVMFVKQLSVFIENREGRLEQVTEVLKTEGINILSLSKMCIRDRFIGSLPCATAGSAMGETF